MIEAQVLDLAIVSALAAHLPPPPLSPRHCLSVQELSRDCLLCRRVEDQCSSFISSISPEGVYDGQSAEPGSLRAKILHAISDVQQGLLERGTEVKR